MGLLFLQSVYDATILHAYKAYHSWAVVLNVVASIFFLQWYILRRLSAYTEYTITVTVYNGHSVSPYNQSITVRTLGGGEQ